MMQYFWMVAAGIVAYTDGKGIIRWVFAAYFFSWFAVIILLFRPKNIDKMAARQQTMRQLAEKYVVKKEFKDINTVDDLMKTLTK